LPTPGFSKTRDTILRSMRLLLTLKRSMFGSSPQEQPRDRLLVIQFQRTDSRRPVEVPGPLAGSWPPAGSHPAASQASGMPCPCGPMVLPKVRGHRRPWLRVSRATG